ncbi:MAG: class I SAM-dependent methyltransferase [Actinomycetota bacterium]|nr:class I SAM-dependent methyltransferase [Actinomycetota bacterium]
MPKTGPFDSHAAKYEAWFQRNRFAYQSELEAIRPLLPGQGDGLEIGVGSGRFAAPLGIKNGIEPSEAMGAIASQRGINVTNGVAEALPFNDSMFDFALMVTTICFVDNPGLAVKEAYRVLKPGGALIIGLIDKDSPLGAFYQAHKNESVFYGPATFYSVDEVVAFLKDTGFTDFRIVQTLFTNPADLKSIEPAKEGRGEGSFVVVKAVKPAVARTDGR